MISARPNCQLCAVRVRALTTSREEDNETDEAKRKKNDQQEEKREGKLMTGHDVLVLFLCHYGRSSFSRYHHHLHSNEGRCSFFAFLRFL